MKWNVLLTAISVLVLMIMHRIFFTKRLFAG